jgi:hypothetical protein
MSTQIRHIPLDHLVPHPGHPNRMSRPTFEKLVRNIERSGRYEPLVVRPCPGRRGYFQIINGHYRCEALRRLGHRTAESVVWRVNDEQTDLLLATLNRLGGRDRLDKKLALLQRLSVTVALRQLAQWLPATRGQLERLAGVGPPARTPARQPVFAVPMVFLVDPVQEPRIEEAIARAGTGLPDGQTRAARRAAALLCLARRFLDQDGLPAAVDGTAAEPADTRTGPPAESMSTP